ncbi:MAG: DUF2141 domain-containing protein [Burkholderiaceae bacterium]
MTRSLFATLLLAALGNAPDAFACERIASIANVKPNGGPVAVAVFTDEASFRQRPAATWRIDASAETLKVPLCAVSAEWLAITVFQDSDANGRLDTNLVGLPKEPWGVSGSAGSFGPPSWAAARVRGDSASVPVVLAR